MSIENARRDVFGDAELNRKTMKIRRKIMRTIVRMFQAVCFSTLFFVMSCHSDDDEPTPCENYCYSMSDCYQLLDQPFSSSECLRNCTDNTERYSSVGCRNRYLDLLECKTDLSCADANNVSEDCAPETEDLVNCVE